MSVFATVRCNCYEQGKCVPPPLPDEIYMDENGYPALGLPQNPATRAYFEQFREWLRNACEHPHMNYCHIRLASGAGYLNFLSGLEAFGWAQLPTLRKTLPMPTRDFRPMKVKYVDAALEELAHFRNHADFGLNAFLVDSETGEVISEYTHDGYGALHTFIIDGRHDTRVGFNRRGIYVIQRPEGMPRKRVVFQAKRLEQRLLRPEAFEHERIVEFVNRNTGRTFVCNTPISRAIWGEDAKIHLEYPRYLHVEERQRDAAYFEYILEPLITVLRAAREMGNPVVWQEG